MAVAAHIAEVMTEVRARIKSLETGFTPPGLDVEIGNPATFAAPGFSKPNHLVTLFLYRIEPDHSAYLASPERGMVVKLKVLINVYGKKINSSQESAETTELRVLSEIMRLFMEAPTIGPIKVKDTPPVGAMLPFVTQGITVEAQQLSLDMEEINHIWTTQGDTPFRTALVYSFNYGVVAPKKPKDEGPPVLRTQMAKLGGPTGPNDMGIYPDLPGSEEDEEKLKLGALAFKIGTGANVKLSPSLIRQPVVGNIEPSLLLITEDGGDFDIVVEKLKPLDGTWTAVPVPHAGNPPAPVDARKISAVRRNSLLSGAALPAGTRVTIAAPTDGEVYRLSVTHQTEPGKYSIGYVTLSIKSGGSS